MMSPRILITGALLLACTACGDTSTQSQSATLEVEPLTVEMPRVPLERPPPPDDTPAKRLFGAAQEASLQAPAAIGSYAKGCAAGSVELPESGPTWQAMRLSRNRNWGHPATVDFIKELSQDAASLPGWNGIYVGDISQPRGGPMLSGHASHQIGLDVDIWLRRADRLDLSIEEREEISSVSLRREQGAYVNNEWTPAHLNLIKAAASDPRVARIFIFPGAKVRMCRDATGDRAWLNKVRPWFGHHYHFHIRLNCPAGTENCISQDPPPLGDGCEEAQQWVDNILNPPPPDPNAPPPRPRPELTLAELPSSCAGVLQH